MSESVHIIDATLREGNQSPGVRFSAAQAVDIASMLHALGVDMIECGHAIVGPHERERIRALSRLGLSVPLLSHARARTEDIVAAKESGSDWVGIFCGINRISRLSRLRGKSQGSVLDMIRRSISFARSQGLKVRYTLEDGTRTPLELVIDVLGAAVAEGADRICYADTLGAMAPASFAQAIAAIRQSLPDTALEIHVHDDRGFAMANAWAGIEAGANWVSTSVNGLGERCGITDLAALLANLDVSGYRPLREPALLQDLSRYVAAVTRSPVDERRPIVGKNAFTHTARLHTQAVLRTPLAYAVFDAERVGREVKIAAPVSDTAMDDLIVKPKVISATELRYHRAGPGCRHVMVDERFVRDARQYCIVREIPRQDGPAQRHVDPHRHICDSLFMFLGREPGLTGLEVEVMLDGEVRELRSPAAMLIPAGALHSYRILGGEGYYVNHVAHGDYEGSLLDPCGRDGAEPADARAAADAPAEGAPPTRAIRDFLAATSGLSPGCFTDHMDLLETGVLDSLGLLELYAFLEQLTGAPLAGGQVSFDSVRTIRSIYDTFVQVEAAE
jgi:2-isopropylmalate synthase